MRIGFTGSQVGLTADQQTALWDFLITLDVTEFHHGDCIGADATAHEIADTRIGGRMVGHPPDDPRKRAWCRFDELRPEAPYLIRNQHIVEETELLIAGPAFEETVRSGTWSTVRYARERGRQIVIVMPDGELRWENAPMVDACGD